MQPTTVYKNWRARLELIYSWGLAGTDRVLEVGSGQNPSARADVLCERYVADGSERHHQPPLIDRPFVVGDIYRLPFRDRAFDFVVCSHVLEHLDDPKGALAELARVAPRGYVETPSRVNEKLLSYPFHKWYVTQEDREMVFRAKDRAVHDPELGEWMGRVAENLPGWEAFFLRNVRALGNVVGIVWEGSQSCRVEGVPVSEVEGDFAKGAPLQDELEALRKAIRARRSASGPAGILYHLLSRRLRRRSAPRIRLDELLACPACRIPVQTTGEDIKCSCGARYPVLASGNGPIPFLVVPEG